jgi:two-component system, NarL family, sensor histidine kinase DegS
MKTFFNWSKWSIATKILFMFLGLSIVSIGVIGIVTNINIENLGKYAISSNTKLGQKAIEDSTNHLNLLGENFIQEKSKDVASQVKMYLESHPPMMIEEMRADQELRNIVVQSIGNSGYTTLIDPVSAAIIIHKYTGQEKPLDSLKDTLPTFWALLKSSANADFTTGYYDWQEVDGSISSKYAAIQKIGTEDGLTLTLWATSYINEFSLPADLTKQEINAAILESSAHINSNVSSIQDIYFIVFTVLVIVVIGLALLLSRVITKPIHALKTGAEAIGEGNLDYKLIVKNDDELGDLADSFNDMAKKLKDHTEQLKATATENIEKEREIQENLRVYMRKVGQAQEDERKRIARDLHDDTIQALVVVSRELEDLTLDIANKEIAEIRNRIRDIIKGLRRFSQELRPSVLDDLGLIPAVQWLATDLTENYEIKATVAVAGRQHKLPPDTELTLFRIIQEALTNIRKHSRAKEAQISINYAEGNVTVAIKDNGKGFELPSGINNLARSGKLGLTGMQERAQLLGGTLGIEARHGKGTIVTVNIPVQQTEN